MTFFAMGWRHCRTMELRVMAGVSVICDLGPKSLKTVLAVRTQQAYQKKKTTQGSVERMFFHQLRERVSWTVLVNGGPIVLAISNLVTVDVEGARGTLVKTAMAIARQNSGRAGWKNRYFSVSCS